MTARPSRRILDDVTIPPWSLLLLPAYWWYRLLRPRRVAVPPALLDLGEDDRRALRRAENAVRQLIATGRTRDQAIEETRPQWPMTRIRLTASMVELLRRPNGPGLPYPYPTWEAADAMVRTLVARVSEPRFRGREHAINALFNVGHIDFPTAQALWSGAPPRPASMREGPIARIRAWFAGRRSRTP